MDTAPAPWQIVSICDRPDCVPILAAWHHCEWANLLAPWTLDEAQAELAAHARGGECPTTLVALDPNGAVLGSVSLVLEDAPQLRDYSPWLASLYVTPAARGRGLGAALVHALCAHAGRIGMTDLYLFTPADGRWYASLGWQLITPVLLGESQVQLMTRTVKPAQQP